MQSGLRVAIVAVAWSLTQTAIAAPNVSKLDIFGEWVGKYDCAQGITSLRLTFTGVDSNLVAMFDFGPAPENPQLPEGRYQMSGKFEPDTRRLHLQPVPGKWIIQPSGYVPVSLDGVMNPEGDSIQGDVIGPGCTEFEVHRAEDLVS